MHHIYSNFAALSAKWALASCLFNKIILFVVQSASDFGKSLFVVNKPTHADVKVFKIDHFYYKICVKMA